MATDEAGGRPTKKPGGGVTESQEVETGVWLGGGTKEAQVVAAWGGLGGGANVNTEGVWLWDGLHMEVENE